MYLRAYCYILTLGLDGIQASSAGAVLNANYLKKLLQDEYTLAFDRSCMHEFVLDLADLKEKTGVTALDIAKGMVDRGIHPPTMYFPLIVHESLMIEPTETESKATLEYVAKTMIELKKIAETDPQALKDAPTRTAIGRIDETRAAREPILRYTSHTK